MPDTTSTENKPVVVTGTAADLPCDGCLELKAMLYPRPTCDCCNFCQDCVEDHAPRTHS